MSQQKLRAIVKVGKSSDIKFNNVQAYRAINYREVEGMLSKDENISFVVFEEVRDTDVNRIKNILKSFNILGIIYNKQPINEEIVDELGMQAVSNLKDLQVYIDRQLGVEVGTFKKEDTDDYNISETDRDNWRAEEESFKTDIENEKTIEGTDKLNDELDDAIKALNNNFESHSEKENEQVQIADIMSKDDIDNELDDFDAIFNSLDAEYKESIGTLDDLENKRIHEEEIDGLKNQLNYALASIRNISEINVHLEDELKQHKEFIDRIKTSDEVIEVNINSADIKKLEEKAEELQNKVNQLNIELVEALKLGDKVAELESKVKEKDIELEKATSNEIVKDLNTRIKLEVSSRLFLAQGIVAINNELIKNQSALYKKMQEVGKIIAEFKELESVVKELNKEKEDIYNSKQETELALGNQVKVLSDKVTELTLSLSDANKELAEKESINIKKDKDIITLTEDLESTKGLLEDTQKILNTQSNEVHRFEAMGADEMQENMLALEESNSTLAEEIGRLRRDEDSYKRQLKDKDNSINSLAEDRKSLTIALKAAARKIGAGESMKINCNYSGRAFVLPVFGSGSFGITSTAVSLAYELKGNVLIMDLDIVNPKVDTWYGKNPLNKNLPDIDNEMKKTAFGALVEKGTDYVIRNRLEIVTTVSENKKNENRVDYFSGIYTRIDMFKLMAVDFSELLTYFGNEYDYIVVDLGRIGGSEITNALIRMFNEISFKNILVALHDGADCRTLSIRAQTERINRNKSIWALNIAKNDRMSALMKNSLSTSKYVIFGRDMKIYGERVPYNKVGILKDRLKELVDLILQ